MAQMKKHSKKVPRRMFLDFYKLREQPFSETPDPRYIYLSPTHREAIASLAYGIEARRGFLALVAEPGMGKTTVLFHLLEWLRESARTAFLFQTQCDPRELLCHLLADLGIDTHGRELAWMHAQLNQVLISEASEGRRLVVFIDEAHNLSESALEMVRLLSDFENPSSKLIQFVLAGQLKLGDTLARPELVQLRQRISNLSRLSPFTRSETEEYIGHRLSIAGLEGAPPFTRDAFAMIAGWSRGVPRDINNLCFNALSLGYAMEKNVIDLTVVLEAAGDLDVRELPTVACDSYQFSVDLISPAVGSASGSKFASSEQEISGANSILPQRTGFETVVRSMNFRRKEQRSPVNIAPLSRAVMVLLGVVLATLTVVDVAGIFLVHHVKAQGVVTTLLGAKDLPAKHTPKSGAGLIDSKVHPGSAARMTHGKRVSSPAVSEPGSNTIAQHSPANVKGLASDVASHEIERVLVGNSNVLPASLLSGEENATVPLGGPLKEPHLTSEVSPVYPAVAMQANVEGDVVIKAVIDTTGRPTKLRVVSGPTLLQNAALDSVRKWQYQPGYLGDKPVAVEMFISVRFRLH
jgi:general secretion pathway protein A